MEKRGKDHLFNFTICLIGKEIDLTSSVCYLQSIFCIDVSDREIDLDSITNVEIYTYDYDIDGIVFNSCHDFNLINKGF